MAAIPSAWMYHLSGLKAIQNAQSWKHVSIPLMLQLQLQDAKAWQLLAALSCG
jgi:uncharacterized protein involved in cysteine biosynthesis